MLLYPGALAGSAGQRFEAMVERGGPLGELVQWADLSACLTILGHNVTLSTSQHQLHRWRLPLDPPAADCWFHLKQNDIVYMHFKSFDCNDEGGKLMVWCVSSLIGAAPGRGSCPIQRPLPFDLVYTDYHGLAHLQGAMGLAFQHYQYISTITNIQTHASYWSVLLYLLILILSYI